MHVYETRVEYRSLSFMKFIIKAKELRKETTTRNTHVQNKENIKNVSSFLKA